MNTFMCQQWLFSVKGVIGWKIPFTCCLNINVCWKCVYCTHPPYNDKTSTQCFLLNPYFKIHFLKSGCSEIPGRMMYSSHDCWLTMPSYLTQSYLLLVYKSLNGLGPNYIADMLTEYKPNRPLGSVGSSQLEIPRVHTKQGESAFSYYAARSGNQLPEEIRCAKTSATFKPRLQTHLFSCAFVECICFYIIFEFLVFIVVIIICLMTISLTFM